MKKRFALAIGIIGFANLISMILSYNVDIFVGFKSMFPLFYLFVIGLVLLDIKEISLILLFILLLMIPTSIKYTQDIIAIHKLSYYESLNNIDEVNSLKKLSSFISDSKRTCILVDKPFFTPDIHPLYNDFLALPVKNHIGYPITYTINWVGHGLELYHRIRIDYILTSEKVSIENFKEIYSCKYYYLYKNSGK